MIFNKVYFPADCISRHADFDGWYEDGDRFMTVKSLNKENPWSAEKDRVAIYSRLDAEMACIKPDHKCLSYAVRVERWTYTLHTFTIFKHYFLEGMLWQIHGTPSEAPFSFENEDTGKKDVRVRRVEFNGQDCFEVKVRDIEKLRMAVCAVLAILIKEEYKGVSEGEPNKDAPWYKKVKRYFLEETISYDEIRENPDATKL